MSNKKLNYLYDSEGDILYLTQGKPRKNNVSSEIGEGIIARYEKSTGEMKGLTILHFLKRAKKPKETVALPTEVKFLTKV